MRAINLLGCLLLGRRNVSAFEVELNELVNPSLAKVTDTPYSGQDQSCAPNGCDGILTRDGSRSVGSRYGCTQPEPPFNPRINNACTVNYRLNEEPYSGGPGRTISSVHVAFAADSETSVQVIVEDEVTDTWTGEKGSTRLQEIPGVAGFFGDELDLVAVMSEGSYIGITETEIYVEVDEVPVTGISASERVSVTASATVNSDAAMDTLDGSTSTSSSWSCSEGDVCEITYDLLEVQSTQQIRIAFVEHSSMAGAKFNVYTAGTDGIFNSVLSGVTAGPRDSSLTGLQTFGGVYALARYVQIEGVPGSGGEFAISEVDIRVNEDAPSYPTATVDSSLVPVGRIPLGRDGDRSVSYDPRPASEGGCSAGHFEGCGIYNIKDDDNSPDSRWSCSPTVNFGTDGPCRATFNLNGYTYLRQIQLAFHKGDERHHEFSINVGTESGPVAAIPSGISSGDTTDFQTWDIAAWTDFIEFLPKFGSVAEWTSIKEMILLKEEQSSDSTPILDYRNNEDSDSAITETFSFDLANVDSEGRISVGEREQDAKVRALRMKFPSNKSFTFEIRHYDDNDDLQSSRFTSAGGDEKWEEFVLPETLIVQSVTIVAVEGPDEEEDYPTLRVNDCQVLGEIYSPGSKRVASTTIDHWKGIPDYIGDGNRDQEAIMMAICDGIGQGFDGTDCDGVVTGNDEALEVNLEIGDYYLDGPVFLKSGVSLIGGVTEDDITEFRSHGSGTGADGVINALGVSGASVKDIFFQGNLETAGPAGTVGNVLVDVKDSQDIAISFELFYPAPGFPLARARFVDTEGVRAWGLYGFENGEGPEVILDGVTDATISTSEVKGATIKDSVNVLFEGGREDGDPVGSIDVPGVGDQSANLVVSGTTSGVTLKEFEISSGAEPRIVLENSNPFTIDEVSFSGGTAGDCIIKIPQGSDGNAVLIQLNVETTLQLEDDCFVLA